MEGERHKTESTVAKEKRRKPLIRFISLQTITLKNVGSGPAGPKIKRHSLIILVAFTSM